MSTSKQDLTGSSSLSVEDAGVSLKNYKRTRMISRTLVCGLVITLCICLALVIALAIVATRYIDDGDNNGTNSPLIGSIEQNQMLPNNQGQANPSNSMSTNTNTNTNPKGSVIQNQVLPNNQGQAQPSISTSTNTYTTPKEKYCLTKDCIYAASAVSSAMDPTANPCDDFHQFACGRWVERHVINEDQSRIGTFDQLRDDVSVSLKIALEKDVTGEDTDAIKKAKNMYRSCMATDDIETKNLTKIAEMLTEFGGWPLLGNKPGGKWTSSGMSLEARIAKLTEITLGPPVMDFWMNDDSKNPTKNIIVIDQPGLGMPNRQYYLEGRNSKALLAYEQYALEVAMIFGADEQTAKDQIAEMIDFEITLANMSMPADQRRDDDKLYNKMTIAQLKTAYTNLDWDEYFSKTLGRDGVKISFTDTEPVIVQNPDYINRMTTYLKNLPNSDRIVSNYIAWTAITHLYSALPKRVRDAHQKYRNVISGTNSAEARWKDCTSKANTRLGMAVGKLYVSTNFDQAAKNNALEMIGNLRKSMKNLIRGTDWMDQSTKALALEKADAMTARIGYYDKILDDSYLNKRYENYTVHGDSFLENTLDYLRNHAAENHRKLRKPVDRQTWDDPAATVNAFYNPGRNQISFPAGILQPPFYHKNYPQYLNYGGIGYVIGHEITHGFDDSGRKYDKHGELKQWWTPTAVAQYNKKTSCIVNQYGSYLVEEAGEYLNGNLTLGENIADNGGEKESFHAYRRWVEENGEELALPGLDYTPNQLFFLNAAQVWCGKSRPAEAKRLIRVDPHSNAKSRVIGPIQNNPDFATAFNCPVGSNMNPVKKCVVW